ncbi:hypothetical protein Fuma_06316 [Fuerstiella marisgermanici]|uniref:Uncharacterized protein n=1 Tax=Fuerstiella marisgermanici TaxID=1891926 RepID=A0A1P8WRF6_9PLAN|nr:hypothetical protein Fuma_06316 [Fuerstiella marisgermanici]
MARSAFNASLCFVGVAIVATCAVLFVQCRRIVVDNVATDNLFAQAVLHDVLRSLPARYPNGITPEELGKVLYSRVSLYTLVGFAFIGAAWARQYGFWSIAARPTTELPFDNSSDS